MILSRDLGMIFVPIPRNAGASIAESLRFTWPDAENRFTSRFDANMTAHEAVGRMPAWSDLFSFAFVRNPWDRMVSLWSYSTHQRTPFADFLADPAFIEHKAMRPQTSYILGPGDRRLVSKVCRFETLERDFIEISKRWGSTLPPPHMNRSDRGHYREHYTPELVELVAERYRSDVDVFGYRF